MLQSIRRLRLGLMAGLAMTALAWAASAVAQEGTLVVARPADIFTFDPYNTQDDRSIFTELQVYERLVKLSADGKGVEPELATEWTVADDGLSATFTLRDGVKFWNGNPLTAKDVAFSLTRAIDQSGSWGFLFSPVKSVEAVDDKTVKLTMSEPFAPLLPALSTFAASIYEEANFTAAGELAGEKPMGTGAYMLESWSKGQEVVLAANPNYWQAGKPTIGKIVFRVVGDDNARTLQLASGDAQVVTDVPPTQVDQIAATGGKAVSVSGTAVGFVTINQKIKPFDEAPVRCALAWALDRESIAQSVYFGKAVAAKSILPSTTFFYDAATNPIGFDLAKAKELLASSSVPTGFSFTATVPSGDMTRLSIAQVWAASLAEIGITMNIEQVEATTAQEMYNTEQYTMRISGWTNDTPDPDELMGVALDYQPQNGLHSSYRSDEARDLVLKGRAEPDAAKRQAIYSELQGIVNRDCPFIYVVEEDRIFGTSAKVTGFQPNSQGKYSFEDVTLAP
ncbi:MAG: Extracellular solute-binding protein family 5 [Devosia sp.]|uniref:ABC transporter substrate-binding protein n=1 Tax=Devosia sp. TaxID=1871048 RepID=UPI00261795E3|nr:ABC transporter substrate-binding protein [Devosia sp.]MDB5541991.1 Extracellular solute-binding protein family 5 [Devosia sp.]